MSDLGISRPGDRQKLLWAGGTVFDRVLGPEHTQGGLALLDNTSVLGDATPLHLHRGEAEVFYLLEGSMRAWFGDEVLDLEAGGAIWLPAGVQHAIRTTSDTARTITITAPAGFADFVRDAGVAVDGDVPSTWEFDVGRIMSAAGQHAIEILGPPPA
ncbi:MAG: hypothetical protein JWN77_667 [Frankiales bacterium]|jgi:mannose-6-phosphate isomerase-like protein (cupin superfamily)|nr:hypothetical protein [Frankiales bacterium]